MPERREEEEFQTTPDVDRVIGRLKKWMETTSARSDLGGKISLSRDEVKWLLGEIEGGREAFGVLVDQKRQLSQTTQQMRRTIDSLSSPRRTS